MLHVYVYTLGGQPRTSVLVHTRWVVFCCQQIWNHGAQGVSFLLLKKRPFIFRVFSARPPSQISSEIPIARNRLHHVHHKFDVMPIWFEGTFVGKQFPSLVVNFVN